MGAVRGAYNILVGKPEGKSPLRRYRHRWGITSRWIFGKYGLGMWVGLIWQGQVASSCEHGDEPSGSIKCVKFSDQLSVFLASLDVISSMELISYL
jgi:hypothetical protein